MTSPRSNFLSLLLVAALSLTICGAALAQPNNRTVNFAVMGDTGSGDEAQLAVARQMVAQRLKNPFDAVIMLGDNIYEKGEEKYIKPRFEDPYKDLLAAGVRFHASLGNHDIIKGLEFQTNYRHFNMGGRRYYNFSKGDGLIEFFALDTNLLDETQLRWLEESLRASKARWKIAFCHHSIYSSARMHRAYIKLRAALEPLYVKYGVNAVFAGHSHCYERTKPQKGVQYFTAGSGGEIKKGTLDEKSPLMAFGNDRINIFLSVRATETELKVEAIGADGSLVDSHTINPK
jgi:predicted phosphodiesterase